MTPPSPARAWARVAWALARHPSLWVSTLRQMRRLAAPGWWRRAPFLPLPSRDYLRFRMETQHGDLEHAPEPTDVLNYLSWCRAWDRVR
jgi:hypothetical protein